MSHGRDRDRRDEDRADDETDEYDGPAKDEGKVGEQNAQIVDHLTGTLLRAGLAMFGFVLLIFALGQVIGFDMVGIVTEFLGSPTGQWLAVATFALALILIAMSGWQYTQETV